MVRQRELRNDSSFYAALPFPAFNGETVLYEHVRSSKVTTPASPAVTVLLAWAALTSMATLRFCISEKTRQGRIFICCNTMVIFCSKRFFFF